MQTLGRTARAAALVPSVALAQATDPAAPAGSVWNWVLGIAALVIVLFLARMMFGRRAGGSARGP